jgi:IclR family transcriptional regulator, acetate operon repressor
MVSRFYALRMKPGRPSARIDAQLKIVPRRGSEGKRSDQVQSLARALSILDGVASADEGTTLTEISQQIGLSPSTAHRLLITLEQARYVHFDPERKLWTIGVQAFSTGNAFLKTRSLVAVARPHMRALMEESEETVKLAIADQGEAIFLAQIECRHTMRAFARPGGRVPLHCSSVGKALLSTFSKAELAKVLHDRGHSRVTAKTITSPAALREDLSLTVTRGYAIDDEEHAIGLRCVAAVIRDENGDAIGALSLSGPMARISDERIPVLGHLVRTKAAVITAQLGGRSPLV